MITSRSTSTFIMIPCRCGRLLRAKWDQVGSEISCWDCHQNTLVTIPRNRLRLLGLIVQGVSDLFHQQGAERIIAAAGLVTLGLLVPYVGLGMALIGLTAGAVLYGDLLQGPDHLGAEFEGDWTRIRRRLTWGRLLACLAFASGMILPIWIIGAGRNQSPHLDRVSLPILALSWTILPLLMAMVYHDPHAPDARIGERARFLRVHPILVLLSLTIVPLMLVGAEVIISALIYESSTMPFFALDYMPVVGNPLHLNGVFYFDFISYVDLPPERFSRNYLAGLKHGFSFVGALPPSLSLPTRHGLNPHAYRMTNVHYLSLRLVFVFLICMAASLGCAIQARCLSVLINAKRNRLA